MEPHKVIGDSDIIFDWNSVEKRSRLTRGRYTLFDETLRDGLQSPSVYDPPIDEKLRIVELMTEIGIDHIDIGLPGSGPRAFEDCLRIAKFVCECNHPVRIACAARTHINDIQPILEISQRAGTPVEVMTFIGSSPIRQYAESWDLQRLLKLSADAIDFTVKNGLPCTYVTEDTTRSRPDVLSPLFRNAIEHGAERLCICDTVGHSTPDGVYNLLSFTRGVIAGAGLQDRIGIDWHGHNDRGLAVANALFALEYGADRVHGTILGVGERVGNAALDQILVNLQLLGELDREARSAAVNDREARSAAVNDREARSAAVNDREGGPPRDLRRLGELVQRTSQACRVPIPYNYPVLGTDAFRTATGVHAAAIIKAEKKGDAFLADRIYSAVPAGLFGRSQEIEIGPMSGESNVVYWLQKRGVIPEDLLVQRLFSQAKAADHLLTSEEIYAIIREHQSGQA